jgi:hypothetical protein
MKKLIAFVSVVLLLALVMGCKHDPDPEPPDTPAPLTKNITVPEITAVKNPMDFGAVSDLSGWDADFPASDVTYTLVLSKGGVTKDTVNSTNATTIAATGQTNGVHTLTQTFYYKGSPITGGKRSVGIDIVYNYFAMMYASEDISQSGSGLPALTLTLSKPR